MVSMQEGPVGEDRLWDFGFLHGPDHRRCLPAPGLPRGAPVLGPPSAIATACPDLPADIVCTPNRVHVTLEAPGHGREDLDIKVSPELLTIRASAPGQEVWHREIALPEPVDPATVYVTYRNGVLDITLARQAEPQG